MIISSQLFPANFLGSKFFGWIPSSFSQSQYPQVDIGKKVKITAVETQEADQHNYWVKTYQVQFSVAIDIPGGKRSLVKNIIAQTTILKRAIKK